MRESKKYAAFRDNLKIGLRIYNPQSLKWAARYQIPLCYRQIIFFADPGILKSQMIIKDLVYMGL